MTYQGGPDMPRDPDVQRRPEDYVRQDDGNWNVRLPWPSSLASASCFSRASARAQISRATELQSVLRSPTRRHGQHRHHRLRANSHRP
jgi:hypothetical protein